MSDVKCVVCGEPWDYYGVTHGDMEAWEADLFKKGAGCPCCEGIPPNGEHWEPESISDIENGDDDPIIRLNAWENSVEMKTPEWKKPEPKVFWQCDGCGVQVIGNPSLPENHEDYLEYFLPNGARARQWYHSHPFHRGEPEKNPAHVFADGSKVCEFCLNHCDQCGKEICSTLEYGDTYDDGNSFPHPYYHDRAICVDCFETICTECNSFPEDCDCNQDEE
jgi:hypothetical protein